MQPEPRPSTPAPRSSEFVFATCGIDAMAWLKRDVARLHPQLRLAFSRPGFVSWKGVELGSDFELQSPVAVVSGWGSGQATGVDALVNKVAELAVRLTQPCVHVFAVAHHEVNEDIERLATHIQAELQQRQLRVSINHRARVGQDVVDVIALGSQQWFVGWHVQRAERFSRPGGVRPMPVPAESPSRAYSKVAELLDLAELSVRAGNKVVELGAAPGGGTLFLLQRGAHVWAIDPAPLAASVVDFGNLRSNALRVIQLPAAQVTRQQLPKRVDYLVSDVNLAPTVSLRYLERLCALIRGPQRGILVNIKVNDEKAELLLASVLQRMKALGERCGLTHMRVAQLPSHRREIGVALRRVSHTKQPKTPANTAQG